MPTSGDPTTVADVAPTDTKRGPHPVDIYSTARFVIPLLSAYLMFFCAFNLFNTGSDQFVIRQFCLELGLPSDCTDDAALQKASGLSLITLVISGAFTILSVGIFGAVSNRMGRRNVLLLSYLAMCLRSLGWTAIYNFPDIFKAHWKVVVVGGTCIYAACGSVLLCFMGVFGVLGDVSAKRPDLRMPLFISMEFWAGLSSVVGIQAAAVLMKRDPKYLAETTTIGFALAFLITLFFQKESLDPEVLYQPIKWAKANVFGQLLFIAPTRAAKKLLNNDFNKVFDKLLVVYNAQHNIDSTSCGGDVGYNNPLYPEADEKQKQQEQDEQTFTRHISSSTSSIYEVAHNNPTDGLSLDVATSAAFHPGAPMSCDELQYANGKIGTLLSQTPLLTPMVQSEGVHDDAMAPLLLDAQGGDIEYGVVSNADQQQEEQETQQQQQHTKLPTLKLTQPPCQISHGNALLCFAFVIFLWTCQYFGGLVLGLFYIKKMYNATSQDYSNLLTISSLTGSIGSFIMVPIIKKFTKTPNHERFVLVGAMWVIALTNALFPFCQTYWQFCVATVVGGVAGALPSGISRSLMANQVTEALQGQVLATIAAIQSFIFVLGGVAFNLMWIKTSPTHPGATYFLCAGIAFVGGCLPLLVSDSLADFNLRIQMITEFTKFTTAERKMKEEQKAAEVKQDGHIEQITTIN